MLWLPVITNYSDSVGKDQNILALFQTYMYNHVIKLETSAQACNYYIKTN